MLYKNTFIIIASRPETGGFTFFMIDQTRGPDKSDDDPVRRWMKRSRRFQMLGLNEKCSDLLATNRNKRKVVLAKVLRIARVHVLLEKLRLGQNGMCQSPRNTDKLIVNDKSTQCSSL